MDQAITKAPGEFYAKTWDGADGWAQGEGEGDGKIDGKGELRLILGEGDG